MIQDVRYCMIHKKVKDTERTDFIYLIGPTWRNVTTLSFNLMSLLL